MYTNIRNIRCGFLSRSVLCSLIFPPCAPIVLIVQRRYAESPTVVVQLWTHCYWGWCISQQPPRKVNVAKLCIESTASAACQYFVYSCHFWWKYTRLFHSILLYLSINTKIWSKLLHTTSARLIMIDCGVHRHPLLWCQAASNTETEPSRLLDHAHSTVYTWVRHRLIVTSQLRETSQDILIVLIALE